MTASITCGTELGLPPENCLGRSIRHLPATSSTQHDARRWCDEGAEHGALVWATTQSQGRGRGGRSWLAPASGIYASLILRPAGMPIGRAPRLTSLACVGLVDGLQGLGLDAKVKWPNDIVFPHVSSGPLGAFKKAAGILVELVTQENGSWCALLGFGINLQPPTTGWPSDLADRATDLAHEGFVGSAAVCLASVLEGLEGWLADPCSDELFTFALQRLRAGSATLGQKVNIPEDQLIGEAVDLDHDGALLVQTPAGLHRVVAGDVWPVRTGKSE